MEFDLEWKPVGQEKLYSKADLSKQKWNGPVSCRQHSYFGICPFRGWGGDVLVVKVCVCILVFVQRLVWPWALLFYLLDKYQKQSNLVEFPLAPGPRVQEYLQQSTQSSQFQPVCGTGDFIFYQYNGKHFMVKTGICQSSRGFASWGKNC